MSPIDDDALDRLADYAAGLLDAAEAQRVRVLVETDPDWARAYAGLTAAGPRLEAALATLADPPIPTEVSERLSAVLALQSPPDGTRTAAVVPISRRRRWLPRVAGIAAVAAAVAAVFGGAVQLLQPTMSNNSSGGSATGPMSQPQAASPDRAGVTIIQSGTDYSAQTVRQVGRTAAAAPVPSAQLPAQPPKANSGQAEGATGGALGRLADPVALNQCLAAVVNRYGGQPTLADYARFNGTPALIVVLATPTGRRIVVAGPSCGLPGAGPDERYSVVG